VRGANLDLQTDDFQRRVAALLEETAATCRFGGPYAPTDVGPLMAATDWVVAPSIWWENSPLVIQEAMQHGRPVICSDIGGMAEKIEDGVNGLLFRRGDPDSLARVLHRAATEQGLWEALHANVRPPLRMQDHLATLSALYDEAAARHGASASALEVARNG
jgi:glycosyltransferase involved in cell wall biosynthesis